MQTFYDLLPLLNSYAKVKFSFFRRGRRTQLIVATWQKLKIVPKTVALQLELNDCFDFALTTT